MYDENDVKTATGAGFIGGVISTIFIMAAILLITHLAGVWDIVTYR